MMIKKTLTNKLIHVYFLVVILPICAVYFVFVILLFSRTLQSESEKYQYGKQPGTFRKMQTDAGLYDLCG